MCGLVGLVQPGGVVDRGEVTAMCNLLAHRGPDDARVWLHRDLALGHRRLSVIDLSTAGRQPMPSADQRFTIVYNGEIYNAAELRAQLSHVAWRGHSDTEVLVEAIACWGVQATLTKLVGMFAFAVYDKHLHSLTLARDRLGIKPLYLGWQDGRLVFASELRVVGALRGSTPTISADVLASMLRHNHVPAPHCIYRGFAKLAPGCMAELQLDSLIPGTLPEQQRYWSVQPALSQTQRGDTSQLQEQLLGHLREAVRCRLVADVPLGAFLSGGVDSSLVVALMQEQASGSVRTFTIGFTTDGFDEAQHAKQVAAHLGTRHTELYVDEPQVLQAAERLGSLSDEPFADASILPTFLLCQMARRDVTVTLSGDGGDELLWGYARYPAAERMMRLRNVMPTPLAHVSAALLKSRLLQHSVTGLPMPDAFGRRSRLAAKCVMAAGMLSATDHNAAYRVLMSLWQQPELLVPGAIEAPTVYSNPQTWVCEVPQWRRMSLMDLLAYLPDDCLTKVDRASMAVGLEARVPLLDHRVVEFCYGLPENAVREGAAGKLLLRRLLTQYLPESLVNRPKAGFSVPLGDWLRGPLREWAQDLLSADSLRATGLIDPQPVQAMLRRHMQTQTDCSASLWCVLMFQAWQQGRATPAATVR